ISFILTGSDATLYLAVFFYSYRDHRDLHSFPTRRSSDLGLGYATASGDAAKNRTIASMSLVTGAGGSEARNRRPYPIVFSRASRSEEHTSELQSRENLVCRLLLEKKKTQTKQHNAGITKL